MRSHLKKQIIQKWLCMLNKTKNNLRVLRFILVLKMYGHPVYYSRLWLIRYDEQLSNLLCRMNDANTDGISIGDELQKLEAYYNNYFNVALKDVRGKGQESLARQKALFSRKQFRSYPQLCDHIYELRHNLHIHIGNYMDYVPSIDIFADKVRKKIESIDKNPHDDETGVLLQANGWGTYYGHQAFLLIYLKAYKNNMLNLKALEIYLVHPDDQHVANKTFQEYLIIFANSLANTQVHLCSYFDYYQSYMQKIIQMDCWGFKDRPRSLYQSIDHVNWLIKNEPLQLTQEHMAVGENFIMTCGIQANKFVTIQIRDGAYGGNNGLARNSSLLDYIETINYLVNNGLGVVVIRNDINTPFPYAGRRVIDYANSGMRSSTLDLYLLSQCMFFICNLSGPLEIANSFCTPVLLTNAPDIAGGGGVFRPNTICLPRLLKDTDTNEILTFRKHFTKYQAHLCHLEKWQSLEYQANTSSDILSAAIEMHEFVKSNLTLEQYLSSHKHSGLIDQFNSVRNSRSIDLRLPISPSFLSDHMELLS